MNQEIIAAQSNVTSTAVFGKQPTDHMFIAEYKNEAWGEGHLKRFQTISLSPFALCFHYGQTVFEGMKAFKMKDGRINIFRPKKHFERFNLSLERMCMPEVPYEMFLNSIAALLKSDEKWIDMDVDSSLYIRPMMIATEEKLGVKISGEYLYLVLCTPAGRYYTRPLIVKVETKFTRACEGGTGFAKCGGNYAGAFYPTHLAKLQGFDQVIWTDGNKHEYIEESGAMNLMFIVDGKLITPELSGTILDGITRDSIISIAKKNGMIVEEKKLSIKEVQQWFETNKRVEAFGAGTAAVVAPIEMIDIDGKKYSPYTGEDASMYALKKQLQDIRYGIKADEWGWNYVI